MPTLSSSFVKHQVASMEDVEEALSRQAQYGGDLVTNLLELANVSEERLTRLLAETHGLEPAPVGELPRAPEEVRKLVPGELAQRYAFYPLEASEGQLAIAVTEPLPGEVESDMAFALGVTIVQRLAPLVRVRQAISRDYGQPLEQRMQRVLNRLAGRRDTTMPPGLGDPSTTGIRPATLAPPQTLRTPVVQAQAPEPAPSPEPPPLEALAAEPPSAPPPEVAPQLELPPPLRPADASVAQPPAVETTPLSPRAAVAAPEGPLAALARRERQPSQRPRRLGPYTAEAAERDLLQASSRDDVLRTFFDFASQYFEYSALFALHADIAEGRDAHGPGASRSKLLSIGVPLDLPSALATARDAPGHALVRLKGEGLDAALAKDLERRPGRFVLLLPVRVRGRCVLILYGDHGDSDVLLESVGDVLSLAPLVSAAIERLILQRKRPGGEAQPAHAPAARRKPALPPPETRAQALASVLKESRSSAPPPHSELPPPPSARPVRSILPPPLPGGTAPQPLSNAPRSSGPTALAAPLSSAPPRRNTPSTVPPPSEGVPPVELPGPPRVADSSQPPPAQRAPHTRPSLPALAPPPSVSSNTPRNLAEALAIADTTDEQWDSPSFAQEPGTRPGAGGRLDERRWIAAEPAEPTPTPSPSYSAQRLQLVPEVHAPEVEPAHDFEEPAELTDDDVDSAWDSGVEVADSRVESYDARPLPAPGESSELKLPSVIVDLANDCRVFLERLIEGDESAGDKLVEIGTAAVTILVQAFPGPLKHPSLRPGGEPPKASDCGPVLRTLLRLGSKSVPFLVVRTNDTDPVVRKWATHLLGELPAPESVHAVARRFFDTDDDVRRVALTAGRLFLAHPEFGALFVAEFGSIAQDPNKAIGMRLAAIEALSEIRHPLCVPELIHVLPHGQDEVAAAARRALSVVARQDFGLQAAAWAEWWRMNGGRHRIEWLIDALTHESQDIRRGAGEELKALTREYFGYYDDLPPRERERAQTRYREWWETRGKARFH